MMTDNRGTRGAGEQKQPPSYMSRETFARGFDDKAVRRNFIKKVYSILMVQLVVTGAIISLFMFVDSIKTYVQVNTWVRWTSWGVSLVVLIALACCESVRRRYPLNIVFLAIFTLCEGVVLGVVAGVYEVDAVLIAVGITAAVTLGLTLFAFQTKIDFTVCGGVLCALSIILMVAGLIVLIVVLAGGNISVKGYMIGYGAAGAFVFSLYLIYHTQLMIGGKFKYALDPEEYIFAALNLYLDVTRLFLFILMIVGGSRR